MVTIIHLQCLTESYQCAYGIGRYHQLTYTPLQKVLTYTLIANYGNIFVACPAKGQIRIHCAPLSTCAATCSNNGTPRPCPLICDDYGCVCPNGTVLDEDNNECVDASECPGTYTCVMNAINYIFIIQLLLLFVYKHRKFQFVVNIEMLQTFFPICRSTVNLRLAFITMPSFFSCCD